MNKTSSREHGLSLVELIVVVAMVAILGMIAYPNYLQYKERARRMDAKTALQHIATLQERFFVTNRRYTKNLTELGLGAQTEAGFYLVSLPTGNDTSFQALAVPAPGSPQANDDDCQQFTLDNQSTRGAVPDPNGECW